MLIEFTVLKSLRQIASMQRKSISMISLLYTLFQIYNYFKFKYITTAVFSTELSFGTLAFKIPPKLIMVFYKIIIQATHYIFVSSYAVGQILAISKLTMLP